MVRRGKNDERFGLLTNTLQLGIDASSAIGPAFHLRKPIDPQVSSSRVVKRGKAILVKGESRSTCVNRYEKRMRSI